MHNAQYWIEKLSLQPHPEGGYFREMYRSQESIAAEGLPDRYGGSRSMGTSIYFLLTGDSFSAFHRIQSDEGWHFYEGSTVTIFTINKEGKREDIKLGKFPENGEHLQYVIPHDYWFAAKVVDPSGYALVGCTVNPGFEFEDFELAERQQLIRTFPSHEDLITRLTRVS